MTNLRRPPLSANGRRSAAQYCRSSRQQTTLISRGIRVLLADDHPVVRMGISSFLARHPQFELLDEAKDGLEALKRARELRPDIVLMDIDMPHLDGLTLTEILREELPQTKIILLSALSTTRFMHRILQSGARGFLSKQASSEEFLKALELVAAGDTFFSPEVAQLALHQLAGTDRKAMGVSNLSDREREILMLIADGLSNKEMATRLDIGTRTVETHRDRIMRKLNVRSVAGLTAFAVANGLVQLPGVTVTDDYPGKAFSTLPKFEDLSELSALQHVSASAQTSRG